MTEAFTPKELADQAQLSFDNGNFNQAAQKFRAAEESYQVSGDHLKAAEMANNHCVALLQAGNPQAALKALEGRERVFDDAGDFRRLAMTWGNRGAALDALVRKEEAGEAYLKSAEIFKQIGENELFLSTVRSLSELQLRSRQPLEAVSTMQAGLNHIDEASLGHRLLKRLFDIPNRLLNR